MSRIIMLIPTGTSVGLTSVSLGVIRAMERKGVRLSVFKPIAQTNAWACWALKLIMNATWLQRFGKSGFINKEGTRPAVVIPTNEELVIAQDASRLTA